MTDQELEDIKTIIEPLMGQVDAASQAYLIVMKATGHAGCLAAMKGPVVNTARMIAGAMVTDETLAKTVALAVKIYYEHQEHLDRVSTTGSVNTVFTNSTKGEA